MSPPRWWGNAPFIVIPKWWTERGLRGSNMLVAVAIVGHVDNETGMWTPAVSLLMKETGLSRRTVQYALVWLELQGFITRNPRCRRASEITVHPIAIGPETRFEIVEDCATESSADGPREIPTETRLEIDKILNKPAVKRARMSGPRKVAQKVPTLESA